MQPLQVRGVKDRVRGTLAKNMSHKPGLNYTVPEDGGCPA